MTKDVIKTSKVNVSDEAHHEENIAVRKNVHTKRIARIGLMMLAVITVLFAFSAVCFAEDDSIGGAISSGLGDAWGVVQVISLPIAVIAIGAGVFSIFAGGERGMDRAKKIFLYTAIGVALIWLAPLLVRTVSGWFDSFSSSSEEAIFG